ncbi:hypothetical protein ACROYT_G044666 [Oculina patagonica]
MLQHATSFRLRALRITLLFIRQACRFFLLLQHPSDYGLCGSSSRQWTGLPILKIASVLQALRIISHRHRTGLSIIPMASACNILQTTGSEDDPPRHQTYKPVFPVLVLQNTGSQNYQSFSPPVSHTLVVVTTASASNILQITGSEDDPRLSLDTVSTEDAKSMMFEAHCVNIQGFTGTEYSRTDQDRQTTWRIITRLQMDMGQRLSKQKKTVHRTPSFTNFLSH